MSGSRYMDGPHLDAAYGLKGEEDNRALYEAWAETYDETFSNATGYQLPELVAAQFWKTGGAGPVLDVGAGTGLVGAHLARLGIGPLDGLDLSADMLAQAAEKNIYRAVFEGNVLDHIPPQDNAYSGAVSAGTFTKGHVGPAGLKEIIRVVRPGGLICLSINLHHWEAEDFWVALGDLGDAIVVTSLIEVPIYSGTGTPNDPNAKDLAKLLTLTVG